MARPVLRRRAARRAGAVVGLAATDRVYGRETDVLVDAAVAQDLVSLTILAPLLLVLGVAAARGSLRAYLCWTGCLAFTAYNYAIYAFSVQFGPLFPVWVAVLGLSVFALVGGLSTLPAAMAGTPFAARAMPVAAWSVIAIGVTFALLWSSEIVPDLLAGVPSRSATTWDVPTNPVHVLDLALFLPAVVTSGVLLLRRHPFGYATVVGQHWCSAPEVLRGSGSRRPVITGPERRGVPDPAARSRSPILRGATVDGVE